jgi:hypothetical protein
MPSTTRGLDKKWTAEPSVSEVFEQIVNLRKELDGLHDSGKLTGQKHCCDIVLSIESLLQQARVFLLSANVRDASERIGIILPKMDDLRAALRKSSK